MSDSSTEELELMVWALSHGWSVQMYEGSEAVKAEWSSPDGSTYAVEAVRLEEDLPRLDDEVRARIATDREAHLRDRQAGADWASGKPVRINVDPRVREHYD